MGSPGGEINRAEHVYTVTATVQTDESWYRQDGHTWRQGMRAVVAWAVALFLLAGCFDRSGSPHVSALPSGTPLPKSSACQDGVVNVGWRPGLAELDDVCVHAGAQIDARLVPPDLHLWTPPASSAQSVAAVVTSGSNQEGVLVATIKTIQPGSAVITSIAEARDGAPDPRPARWQLTVTVIE